MADSEPKLIASYADMQTFRKKFKAFSAASPDDEFVTSFHDLTSRKARNHAAAVPSF